MVSEFVHVQRKIHIDFDFVLASPSIETPLDRDSDDSDYEDIDENNPIESLQAISINVSKDNLIKVTLIR